MRRYKWLIVMAGLILCGLAACGIQTKPAAPMAAETGMVRVTMTALPEDLSKATLLARNNGIILGLSDGGRTDAYDVRPATGAYRRMEVPIAGDWEILTMTPAPDGGLWTVLQSDEGCMLMKSSGQGAVLTQQELGAFRPETMVCDSNGHVFLAGDQRLRRYAPDGLLQQETPLEEPADAVLHLAARKNRVFLRSQLPGKDGCYREILEDLSLGEPFPACVSEEDAWPIGSFLPEYTVMELDSVGLYACREDGQWETVCLWSEQHLEGTVGQRLLGDLQGNGAVLYEKDGVKYSLTLSPA